MYPLLWYFKVPCAIWGNKAKIIITRWDRNLNFQSRLSDYITGHRFFPWSDLAVPSVWASPSVRAPNLPTFALTLRLRCIYAKPCWSFRSKEVGKENLFFRLRSSNASFIALSRSSCPKHLPLHRSLLLRVPQCISLSKNVIDSLEY